MEVKALRWNTCLKSIAYIGLSLLLVMCSNGTEHESEEATTEDISISQGSISSSSSNNPDKKKVEASVSVSQGEGFNLLSGAEKWMLEISARESSSSLALTSGGTYTDEDLGIVDDKYYMGSDIDLEVSNSQTYDQVLTDIKNGNFPYGAKSWVWFSHYSDISKPGRIYYKRAHHPSADILRETNASGWISGKDNQQIVKSGIIPQAYSETLSSLAPASSESPDDTISESPDDTISESPDDTIIF